MGKRKAEDELSRFVWKRNPQYDLTLLAEVENFNPYAFNNQKPIWHEVAINLQDSALRMKVTDRSCRERVTELLKIHRKGELASIRASGTSEEEMTKMHILLTSVAKLEEAKPNKQLKSLFARNDKEAAEAERSKALESVDLDSSDDDEHLKKDSEEKKDGDDEEFEFGPNNGQSQNSNPKKDLVKYLENKSKNELKLRKEELRIRELETQNKSKELELQRLKMESEAEERKKFMEALINLATRKYKTNFCFRFRLFLENKF